MRRRDALLLGCGLLAVIAGVMYRSTGWFSFWLLDFGSGADAGPIRWWADGSAILGAAVILIALPGMRFGRFWLEYVKVIAVMLLFTYQTAPLLGWSFVGATGQVGPALKGAALHLAIWALIALLFTGEGRTKS